MSKQEDKMEPTFVARDGMLADKEYVTWLSELKQRFQSSRAKAAVRVNTAMLEYYWSLGRDIVKKKADSKWGSGFFNQLSDDMRSMFPNETGFSVTNLKYMKRWYSFYNEQVVIRQQAADELEKPISQRHFYVTAADKLLRGAADNPSVGLVICKTAKKTVVEWSLQDIQKPLGVATYQLQEVVDRTVAELELRKNQKEDEA